MPTVTETELGATLELLQAQMAELSKRIRRLEGRDAVPERAVATPSARTESVPASITEEELIAISAAIGAFLGVRAHIRQIRLVSTSAWAQEGRVSIQASHRLQG